MGLVFGQLQLVHLTSKGSYIGGVFAERGVGMQGEHPYSLVNFGAILHVERGPVEGRVFKTIACRLTVPEFEIEKLYPQVPIDMMAEMASATAEVKIYSFPLGFVKPADAHLTVEFLDGSTLIRSITVPIIFSK